MGNTAQRERSRIIALAWLSAASRGSRSRRSTQTAIYCELLPEN